MTRLVLVDRDMNEYAAEDILSFSFVKDAYQPYTKLNVLFAADLGDIEDFSEVKLYIDGKLVHHGGIDTADLKNSGGRRKIRISSSGFTAFLCKNQIEPGLKPQVSLNSLMDSICPLPYVTHEDNTDTSSYIYVKQNSSVWDALVSLSFRLCGRYPYIRDTNTVSITPYPNPTEFICDTEKLIAEGTAADRRKIGSNYHMADINGEYGQFTLENQYALDRKIVRHSYSELDMRFLYSPMQALEFRKKFDMRAVKSRYFVYSGYNGEDLWDNLTVGTEQIGRIMFVEINGSSKGIFTKTGTYTDEFPKE